MQDAWRWGAYVASVVFMQASWRTILFNDTLIRNQAHGAKTMKEVQKTMPASGDMLAIYQALDRVQAIIEFELD